MGTGRGEREGYRNTDRPGVGGGVAGGSSFGKVLD